jgi:DNA-binding NarL/FixJ family response regulator
MEKKIRLLLADDHKILSDGLRTLLESSGFISVIGDAPNGLELVRVAQILEPDIILTDINMPLLNGLEAAIVLKEKMPEVKIIVLSMHESEEYITKAYQAGVDGYLLKDAEKEELLLAIKKVMGGTKFFGNSISQKMMQVYLNKKEDKLVSDLTIREKEVLKLIIDGFKNKEIADKLFVSPRTVDAHRFNVMQKLNVKNTAELVRVSLQKQLV